MPQHRSALLINTDRPMLDLRRAESLRLVQAVIGPEIHGHGRPSYQASRQKLTGDTHVPLLLHHLFNRNFIFIGLWVAGFKTLPQATISLGVKQLFITSDFLETMVHVAGDDKMVFPKPDATRLGIPTLEADHLSR